MANLTENTTWEPGIYQLEETDVVQGGANGIDNLQAKQLAARTQYLKQQLDTMSSGKLDKSSKASQGQAEAGTDNETWMTPLRVYQAIVALANISSATETYAGKVELATAAETLSGIDTTRACHPAGVKSAIQAAITSLINASPAAMDTLAELATALGNDPNFATTITNALAQKAALAVAQTFTKAQRGAVSALVDNGTIAVDLSLANNFSVTIAGARVLGTPSNVEAGQSGVIAVKQDATGGRTLAFAANWKFANGQAPALTTTANATDYIAYYAETSTRIYAALVKDVK